MRRDIADFEPPFLEDAAATEWRKSSCCCYLLTMLCPVYEEEQYGRIEGGMIVNVL